MKKASVTEVQDECRAYKLLPPFLRGSLEGKDVNVSAVTTE